MALSTHNIISIVQIILFLPFLAIAIFLCIRHGFGRNAGWLLLVIFSLVRIVGASLQLATISQPDSIGLYIGSLTLQSVGLSPFIVMMLALLNRVLESIEKTRSTLIKPRMLRFVQLIVIVGLILAAIGGSNSGTSFAQTGVYQISDLSQAGIALTIVGFVLLVLATAVIATNISAAEPGEKRVLLAVALSLPFLFIRVLYSAIGTYNPTSSFSLLRGNIYIFLGTAVIEEFIMVIIIEGMGLTLQVRPKSDTPSQPGMLRSFGSTVFNRVERRYDAGYEPRRTERAEGRHEGRHERRHAGYEMQRSP
ncbi:hypothetical protein F4859DRAFT_427100 [Xylaria cf. heliscus]|nr:hypothetical protein F4859DRAFT_427100 [Xylaria cf. heliscus]